VPYDIAALKAKQDQRKAREAPLLERFHEFRDGLFERLDQFTREALAAGLEGVGRCTRRTPANDIIEVRCRLNTFDVVFIATDTVGPLEDVEAGREIFAARVLVYPDNGDGSATPRAEALVWENEHGGYSYAVRYFRPEGGAYHLKASSEVSHITGQQAADAAIDFMYSFMFTLNERPTLDGMTSGKDSRGVWGLVPAS
jgi:hypothetical protein